VTRAAVEGFPDLHVLKRSNSSQSDRTRVAIPQATSLLSVAVIAHSASTSASSPFASRADLLRRTVCDSGFTQCGGDRPTCVPDGTPCPTGGLRRRNMARSICPSGFEACPVGSDAEIRRRLNRYECINTKSDLESCEHLPTLQDEPYHARLALMPNTRSSSRWRLHLSSTRIKSWSRLHRRPRCW
jgi:hypothetical protein